MSATQTPPEQQPTGRQCPRCGAPITEEQEWCLSCGAAVGTRVVAAPGWRAPIILAGVICVIAAVAVAIAIVQLADDTDRVGETPPATAQATPTVTPEAGTATPDPSLPEASGQETPEPTTTPEPSSAGGADIASWPSGKSGWTVVLASKTSESEANDAARQFSNDGIGDVGVLNSDHFSSLKSGFWVVFSGQYDSQSAASDALDGIDTRDAYIRRVVPN